MSKHKKANAITNAPGNAVSFLTDLIFGNHRIKSKSKLDSWEKARRGGLVGTIANTCSHVGRSISKFVYKHKKAISIACWVVFSITAAVAIAGTICMFCFPGAFAAAASFSIFGMTLAGMAGANPGAQLGVAIGLVAALTLGIAFVVTALINATNAIIRMSKGKNKKKDEKKPDAPAKEAKKDLTKNTSKTASKTKEKSKEKLKELPGSSKPMFSILPVIKKAFESTSSTTQPNL